MHEIGYPEVDAHSKLHTALLVELQMELQKIQHHAEFPEDLLYTLNHWLLDHFESEDAKIATFMRSNAARPIGDSLYREFLFTESPTEAA
jgi:hemerythrin